MSHPSEYIQLSVAEIRSIRNSRVLGFYFAVQDLVRGHTTKLRDIANNVMRCAHLSGRESPNYAIHTDARWMPGVHYWRGREVYPAIPRDKTIRKLHKLLSREGLQQA